MDDKQFEQRMQLAKKSYDRMTSSFNKEQVINQLHQPVAQVCQQPRRQKWRTPIAVIVTVASMVLLAIIIYSVPQETAISDEEKLIHLLEQKAKKMQKTLGLSDDAMTQLSVMQTIAHIKAENDSQFIEEAYNFYNEASADPFELPPSSQNFHMYGELTLAYNSDLWDGKLTDDLIQKAKAQHIELVTQNNESRFYLRLPAAMYDELDDNLKQIALHYQYGQLGEGNYTAQELQPILQAYERLLVKGENVVHDYANGLAFVLNDASPTTQDAIARGMYGEVAKEMYEKYPKGGSSDLLQYELVQQFNLTDQFNYTEFGRSIDANIAVIQGLLDAYTPAMLAIIRESLENTAIFYVFAKQQGIDVSSFVDSDYAIPQNFDITGATLEVRGHYEYGRVTLIFTTDNHTLTLPMYNEIVDNKLMWRIGKG